MRSVPATLAILLLSLTTLSAHAEPITFRATQDTVRVDGSNTLSVSFNLLNPSEHGVYPDSLTLESVDQDPGESPLPRRCVTSLESLVKMWLAADAGSGQQYGYSTTAPFEHGTLTFRLAAHDGTGARMAFTVRVVVAGSMLGDDYPSETLRASGRTIEVVPMAAQGAGGPAPGVLLVHDESSQARRLLQLANAYAQRGWNVLVVSQPGYGTSSGARDWAGPGTLAALSAALDKLKATRGVDPARLYVQGSGLGATAALLLAAQRNDLAGVIASSPEPDLWSAWRGADEPLRARIVAEAGRDSAAWRARSPLSQTSRIRTRLCLIQYSGGSASGLAASRALVTALDRPGQRVDAHLPDAQHRVDRRELNRIVTGFISAADH